MAFGILYTQLYVCFLSYRSVLSFKKVLRVFYCALCYIVERKPTFSQKHQLMQQLAENAFVALQPLNSHMATDDSQLTDFFAGLPPLAERDAGKEGETGEDEGREGEDEAVEVMEEDVANPPRAKMSRSQVRALDVVTLQVRITLISLSCVFNKFVHLCLYLCTWWLC